VQGYYLGRPTSFKRALTTARHLDGVAEQRPLYVIAT
jgi:hypothetical protein